jgi:ADP-heptose:LPS heptosyltransferase
MTLVNARFRAGFCAPLDAGGDCLDIAVPDPERVSIDLDTGRPLPAELRLLLLATAVIATFRPRPHPAGRLVRSNAAQEIVARPYAILAPGAGSPIKLWPADRFVAVARALQDRHGLDIVITGGAQEREAALTIATALQSGGVSNLAGCLPLTELPTVISQARLYVGLDTGTTHLAAALGIPTIAIISGVPDLDVWHTQGRKVTVVVGRVPCSPCNLTRPTQCRYGVVCLSAITTDHVIAACDAVLQQRPSHALAESAG